MPRALLERNICGQEGATPVPSNFPRGLDSFCGGFSRRFPVGGSAKGIPLNVSTPRAEKPVTEPVAAGRSTLILIERSSRAAAAMGSGMATGSRAKTCGSRSEAGMAATAAIRPRKGTAVVNLILNDDHLVQLVSGLGGIRLRRKGEEIG